MKYSRCATSLPLWECGLKLYHAARSRLTVYVTPLVGVWIEIVWVCDDGGKDDVTPLVGVWIEIISGRFTCTWSVSHSPCGSVD